MKRLIFLLCLFLIVVVANAQYQEPVPAEGDQTTESLEDLLTKARDPSDLPATQEYASGKLERRKFDQEKWRDIVNSRNYNDTKTKKSQNEQRSGQGREGQRSESRGERDYDYDEEDYDEERYEYDDEGGASIDLSWLGPVGQIIFYGVIIAIIVMILLQIIRHASFKSNPKRTVAAATSVSDVHDITELDTEDLIQKAHLANDYKLAIRLYFLHLLKKLNEKEIIVWTKDKTNRDYLSELFSKQYYFDEVRKLTLAYERVWYGEHVPTAERYQELRNEFQEINQKFKAS